MVIERLFFAAGSRSHEKLIKNKANGIDPRFNVSLENMGYKVKPLAAEEAQAA